MNKRWTRTPEQRYWDKVDRRGNDECWPWIGGRNSSGYGSIYWNGRSGAKAHRVGYEMAYGPILPGHDVCHTCDNPICQNPSHWFIGTRGDNNADKVSKGRQARGETLRAQSHTKLDWAKVRAIRAEWAADPRDQRALAAKYGVSQAKIWHVIHGKGWAEPGQEYPTARRGRGGEKNERAQLTNEQARAIRKQHAKGSVSQAQLARAYRVSRGVIHGVISGKTFRDAL